MLHQLSYKTDMPYRAGNGISFVIEIILTVYSVVLHAYLRARGFVLVSLL